MTKWLDKKFQFGNIVHNTNSTQTNKNTIYLDGDARCDITTSSTSTIFVCLPSKFPISIWRQTHAKLCRCIRGTVRMNGQSLFDCQLGELRQQKQQQQQATSNIEQLRIAIISL